MVKEKISLIILSCDKNNFLWDGFFKLLDKYWINHPKRIILSSEKKIYENPSIISSTVCDNNEDWSSRLYHAICDANTEFVILLLDDFYIKSYVNEKIVNEYINLMFNDLKIVGISFESQPGSVEFLKYKKLGLVKRKRFSTYRINAQPGIWRSSYLKKILRQGETPWQFELSGTFRSFFMSGDLYAVKSNQEIIPTDKGWLIVRGKLNEKLVEYYLKEENIDLHIYMCKNCKTLENHSNKKGIYKFIRILKYSVECIRSLGYKKIKDIPRTTNEKYKK